MLGLYHYYIKENWWFLHHGRLGDININRWDIIVGYNEIIDSSKEKNLEIGIEPNQNGIE